MANATHEMTLKLDEADLARLEAVAARIEAAAERLASGGKVTIDWNQPFVSTADVGATLCELVDAERDG